MPLVLRLSLVIAVWFSTVGFVPALQTAASLGKIYPPINATNVPAISLTLQWSSVQGYTGPVSYRYCMIPGNKSKCPPGKWVRVGTALSATLNNLTPNTTYKWWVRAYNSQNVLIAEADNGPWTFHTMNVPANFEKTSPLNNSTNHPVDWVTLNWGSSTGAATYQYCIDTSNNNICDTGWVTASSGVVISGLSSNSVYYWQVRAVNSGGSTPANIGTWWQFTTVVLPGVFGKLSPAQNAAGQPINNTVLSWNISTNITGYSYCVSTSEAVCTGTWQPTTATSATVTGLAYNTSYFWQVRAISTGGELHANGGTWWKFTTQLPPPAAFLKLTPANAVGNHYTDVTFSWQPSTGAEHYEFCLSSTANDVTCGGLPWEVVYDTSYMVSGLDLATTWYWQVRAVNSTGTADSNNGAWWSFTTQPNPPLPFTKSTPADEQGKTSTSLNLTWNPSATAGVSYQICIDTTADDACDQNAWKTVTTGSSYPQNGLENATTYYWQVRASNAGGTTYADNDMAAWWSFTTVQAAPKAFARLSPQDGSKNLLKTVTLQWEPSDVGVTYQLCYDQTNNDSCDGDAWVPVGTYTTYDLSGLENEATYYWQVRAANSDGVATESSPDWWSFAIRPIPPTSSNFKQDNVLEDQPVSGSLEGADRYAFTLYGTPPPGALDLLQTGHFTYTPPENFYGTVTFQFIVSDGINDPVGPYTAEIHYVPVNDPPVLSTIDIPPAVRSGDIVEFTATATDVDLAPGSSLTFSIDQLPPDATFDPQTGAFHWATHWLVTGPNTFHFTISVSDGSTVEQVSQQEIEITVEPLPIFLPITTR